MTIDLYGERAASAMALIREFAKTEYYHYFQGDTEKALEAFSAMQDSAHAAGRASALAELHPQWLAEKERAERAEAALAQPSAKVPEGWTLAPEQATEAMYHAGQNVPEPRAFGAVYRAMIAATPAAPGAEQLTPLDYRAQGREEALAVILAEDAENAFMECIGSERDFTGEYNTFWKEDKLRELLHIGDRKHDAYDRAEAQYWEALGRTDEAKRAQAFAENMHNSGKVLEALAKHGEFDLMADLCTAKPQPVVEQDERQAERVQHSVFGWVEFKSGELHEMNWTHGAEHPPADGRYTLLAVPDTHDRLELRFTGAGQAVDTGSSYLADTSGLPG